MHLRGEHLAQHVVVIVDRGGHDVDFGGIVGLVAAFGPFHFLILLGQVPPQAVEVLRWDCGIARARTGPAPGSSGRRSTCDFAGAWPPPRDSDRGPVSLHPSPAANRRCARSARTSWPRPRCRADRRRCANVGQMRKGAVFIAEGPEGTSHRWTVPFHADDLEYTPWPASCSMVVSHSSLGTMFCNRRMSPWRSMS